MMIVGGHDLLVDHSLDPSSVDTKTHSHWIHQAFKGSRYLLVPGSLITLGDTMEEEGDSESILNMTGATSADNR